MEAYKTINKNKTGTQQTKERKKKNLNLRRLKQ